MEIITTPRDMQSRALTWRTEGRRIALLPTMGALHAGHVSLVEAAKHTAGFRPTHDKLIVSIFVNPLQFGPQDDLSRYPRPLAADIDTCVAAGVDCVFTPSPGDMYPTGFQTEVSVKDVSQGLCGASRPGHFTGVATVVLKLFMMTQPHLACFGEKDFQQVAVIRQMVRDLNLPIDIVACPIRRDPDGLALSSRNVYLSPDDRRQALALPQALAAAHAQVDAGETNAEYVTCTVRTHLVAQPAITIDYIDIVDSQSLTSVSRIERGKTQLLAAIRVGHDPSTRLIDTIAL